MLRTVLARNPIAKRLLPWCYCQRTARNASNRSKYLRNHDFFPLLAKHGYAHLQVRRNYADFPEHKIVAFPSLSPTMETGKITNWMKKEGDQIKEGDLIVEIETDKATLGMEAADEGYLAKILLPVGSVAPIGVPLCIMVDDASKVAAFKDYKVEPPPVVAPPAPIPAPGPAPVPVQAPAPALASAPPTAMPMGTSAPLGPAPKGGRVLASPLAQKLAKEKNIQLQGQGSGMFGSIISADLGKMSTVTPTGVGAVPDRGRISPMAQTLGEKHGQLPVPSTTIPIGALFVDTPVSGIRTTIAKRLIESKTQIPHYYLSITCNVDKLLAFRKNHNDSAGKTGTKLSVNDFMIKACAYASVKVPEVNAQWMGSMIRQFRNVDVSVAVAAPSGLITPIVFSADSKGITEISVIVKDLAKRAKAGKLKPQEYQGGTISISNLGMFGVDQFSAIINPPQCSILAVGTTTKHVVASGNGFKEASFISVTLSSDHRVADGAIGAQWLQAFRRAIEDPITMIL